MFEWLFGKSKVAVQVPESASVYSLFYPEDMSLPEGTKLYVATYLTEADAHAVALEDGVEHYSIERNDGNGRLFSVVHVQ